MLWANYTASHYGNVELTFGAFAMRETHTDDADDKLKYITDDIAFLGDADDEEEVKETVFFLYKEIKSFGYTDIVRSSYQYFLFKD